jgi:Family of unknown function (DUF6328)
VDATRDLADDRHETESERMDRNWSELLQELRVTQTGTQILTGFLLTVPFQQRFETLDAVQRGTYLALVLLAVAATTLFVAPVAVHRMLFRLHLKPLLIRESDLLARAGLVVLAAVLTGCTFLLFDIVLSRRDAFTAACSVAVVLVALWFVVPWWLTRRALKSRIATSASS